MVIKIAFSVDDVAPKVGYGLLLDMDPLKYLTKLNEEFGCKFTLFTIPVDSELEQQDIRNNKVWCEKIRKTPYYEIAAHGLTHKPIKPEMGGQEFLGRDIPEIEMRIKTSKDIFNTMGFDVQGFKSPGWAQPVEIYDILKKHGFKYIGDHFIGTKPISHNGIYRIPYTFSIEKIFHAEHQDGDVIILHSHINPVDGRTLNAWNEQLYQNVRGYLQHMKKKHGQIEFVFMKDLI